MRKVCHKSLVVIMVFMFLMNPMEAVRANQKITVLLNGVELAFDVVPQIIKDRVFVPLRKISEELGAEVKWQEEGGRISLSKGSIFITMRIGSLAISVNEKVVDLEAPPQIVEGRTLVPLRAIAEGFNADVKWDGNTQTVYITTKEPDTSESQKRSETSYIYAEAPGYDKMISAEAGDWHIIIPEAWQTEIAYDGNHIFTNITQKEREIIYVQMRGLQEIKNPNLKDMAESVFLMYMDDTSNGMSNNAIKEPELEKINGIDYYKFSIERTYTLDTRIKVYSTHYLTMHDGLLFEFGYSFSTPDISQTFMDVIQSFNPLAPNETSSVIDTSSKKTA